VVSWGEFTQHRPDLARAGRELLCQFGVGLAFLATVRRSGAPRLHPICALLTDDALYGLIIPSPKLRDLERDGRYTLHSYPCPHNEDAFSLGGRAEVRTDPGLRSVAIATFLAQPGRHGPPLDESHFADQTLVEFGIETCLLTRTTGHGDPSPQHTIWRASQRYT
jgi:hypothetical protein